MSNEGAGAEPVGERYEFIRKAGPYEALTHLFHDLGVQSNILVSAQYAHPKFGSLTTDHVYCALREVIKEHAALSTIGVTRPSEKKEGNHQLWEVHLPVINLKDCVVLIDDLDGEDAKLATIFETAHNQWFDTKDQTKPWWKLVLYKGTLAVFVYHHSIGDGLSGYTFHRSLQAALNRIDAGLKLPESSENSPPPVVEIETLVPSPYPLDQIDEKLSWPYIIYGFLFWQILRILVNQKYFLFSDAKFSKVHPTVSNPLPMSERTITRAKIWRIEKDTISKCLVACRNHKTSFTALFHTLIQATLAADVYPNAKLGFSRQAVNVRPLLKVNPGPDQFNNAASQYGRVQWLSRYRAAGSPHPNSTQQSQNGDETRPRSPLNMALIWRLAQEYKAGMNRSIHKTGHVIQDFLMGKLLGEDIEDAGNFYGLDLYQNNSFLISNLGVFKLREEMSDGGWAINEVGFSAGAIRATMGDVGMSFNVASVDDGDCVVCVTWEEGVLEEEMVQRVIDGARRRLGLMV